MNRSQLVVLMLILFIAAGVAAWSWVNFEHRPNYNPEKAHLFLELFYARCDAAHGGEICDPVVGDYHRQCFRDHLEFLDGELAAEEGPVRYDLNKYLDCMNQGVDQVLSHQNR